MAERLPYGGVEVTRVEGRDDVSVVVVFTPEDHAAVELVLTSTDGNEVISGAEELELLYGPAEEAKELVPVTIGMVESEAPEDVEESVLGAAVVDVELTGIV